MILQKIQIIIGSGGNFTSRLTQKYATSDDRRKRYHDTIIYHLSKNLLHLSTKHANIAESSLSS